MANPENENFEVHQPEAEAALREIGNKIKDMTPAGMGFTVLLFDLEGAGENAMFYMSSADRSDMVEAMKEFISKYDLPTK